MATLTLKGGRGSFTWTISGLSNWFATNQYISAGIATKQFDGGVTSISGVVDRVYATENGTSFSVSNTVSYSGGEYTFYGFAQGSDGTYWPAGSGSVTVTSSGDTIIKWSWNSNTDRQTAYRILMGELPVSAGFKASVWNDLVNKVDEVLRWSETRWGEYNKNSLSKQQCKVSSGQTLSADIYNSVVWNTDVMWGSGLPELYTVKKGDVLTGSHIINLVNQLNYTIDWINS